MASGTGLWLPLWSPLQQLLLLMLLLLCAAGRGSGDDAGALLRFKAAVEDPTGFLAGWQEGKPVCGGGWGGVTCEGEGGGGHVTQLDLTGKNISGELPDAVGELWALKSLNLGYNQFQGLLPDAVFANLTSLEYLNITFNNFSGNFPNGLGKLQGLLAVDAYSNAFTGPLPTDLPLSEMLESLHLGGSYFQGTIPPVYGQFKSLKYLHLGGNLLTGPLPPELGRVTTLEHVEMQYNAFQGAIPPEWGNLSSLTYLDVGNAGLSGPITGELGRMEKLDTLFLVNNQLTGPLPPEIGSLVNLKSLDLSQNAISGGLPPQMAGMLSLTYLNLLINKLDGPFPAWIGKLPSLVTVYLWGNRLTGELPPDWGMNAAVERVDVSENQLVGEIPAGLCQGGALVSIIMFINGLSGRIPDGLASCATLQRVRLQDNFLSGQIPAGFGSLPQLQRLELSNNSLSGPIPPDLMQSLAITFIDLSTNRLNGSLPQSEAAWAACRTLQELHIAQNILSGSVPGQIGGCTLVTSLDLSENEFTGSIPAELGLCLRLVALNLSKNMFGGEIPASLSALQQLAILDVSTNNLSGSIPPMLGSVTSLDSVNVSYNALTGPIPGVGIFQLLNASYFMGNPGLCGGGHSGLPSCGMADQEPAKVSGDGGGDGGHHKKVVWLVAAIFGVAAVLLLLGVLCFLRQYRWYNLGSAFRQEFDHLKAESWPWKLTAFQKVGFTAAEIVDCLKEVNVVGKGGAGTVYKGEMQSGEVVAVKKLVGSRKSLSPLADHGFSAEVDLLGNIRHRNIVRLLAYCSNTETELLVYEYMPNGSLGEMLHGHHGGGSGGSSRTGSDDLLADWVTRYRIAVGVAQGLCYLHHDSNPQIVHRDIKSSNILLDSEMEACVADFGVAKLFLQSDNRDTMSVIAGSYGYIAPEYAYTMKVDEKSDIYSFGVVLLELLTGRRPAEPEFGDSQDIVQWVSGKLRNRGGLTEVLDPNLGASGSSVQEEMLMVLKIALRCTSRYPDDRPSMRDVVIMLAEAEPRRKGSFKNPLWSTPHRSPLL